MGELQALFQSFYSHFVLRDLFGKVGPGAMLICAIAVGFTSFSNALDLAGKAGLGAWVVFGAAAWLIGLSLQGLGEIFHFIRYYPKNVTQSEWEDNIVRFRENATQAQIQDFERFTVIKEAGGNASLAALFATVVILVTMWGTIRGYAAAGVIALSIPGLVKIHFANAKRGCDYVKKVLGDS